MLNFDGEVDANANTDVTCEQRFTLSLPVKTLLSLSQYNPQPGIYFCVVIITFCSYLPYLTVSFLRCEFALRYNVSNDYGIRHPIFSKPSNIVNKFPFLSSTTGLFRVIMLLLLL